MSSNNIGPFSDSLDIFEDSDNALMLSPFDLLDDSWSLYHEILQIAPENNADPISTNATIDERQQQQQQQHDLAADDQEQADAAGTMLRNGLKLMRISTTCKSNIIGKRKSINNNNNDDDDDAEEAGPSAPKKLDHNAKERIRRMKLNASYLALQALLPDYSRRSKKRYSAPAIVDRAMKYIPELQNEIQELRSKKEQFIPSTPKLNNSTTANRTSKLNENPTVSITGVDREEAIVQICMARKGDTEDGSSAAFTNLLQSVENEGMCIKSASSLRVCESRACFILHVQINQSSSEENCIEELRDKVISWLR